jgi:Tfp pilus assembly protein PilO
MTTIEQKEIRGITGKLIRGTIWQTVVIVVTVCGFYFQLKGDIRDLYTLRQETEKYWQLKFDQIQMQNNIFQKQLDEISIRLENLRTQIEKK